MRESCALRPTKTALVRHVTNDVPFHNKLDTEAQASSNGECNSIKCSLRVLLFPDHHPDTKR